MKRQASSSGASLPSTTTTATVEKAFLWWDQLDNTCECMEEWGVGKGVTKEQCLAFMDDCGIGLHDELDDEECGLDEGGCAVDSETDEDTIVVQLEISDTVGSEGALAIKARTMDGREFAQTTLDAKKTLVRTLIDDLAAKYPCSPLALRLVLPGGGCIDVLETANQVLAAVRLAVPVQRVHGLYTNQSHSPVPAPGGRHRIMFSRLGVWSGQAGPALLELLWSFFGEEQQKGNFPFEPVFLSVRVRAVPTIYAVTYEEMSQFYACVFWPWDVMMMLFSELYTMLVPLFLPDRHWIARLPGSEAAYWLSLTEFEQSEAQCLRDLPRYPSLGHFRSVPDLLAQLRQLDPEEAKRGMRAFNEVGKFHAAVAVIRQKTLTVWTGTARLLTCAKVCQAARRFLSRQDVRESLVTSLPEDAFALTSPLWRLLRSAIAAGSPCSTAMLKPTFTVMGRPAARATSCRGGRSRLLGRCFTVSAQTGDVALVTLALQCRADIEQRINGQSALDSASQAGQVQIAEVLLQARAAATQTAQGRWTPLMRAAQGGHLKVCELLLASGVDPDEWAERTTALDVAVSLSHLEVVKALEAKQARRFIELPAARRKVAASTSFRGALESFRRPSRRSGRGVLCGSASLPLQPRVRIPAADAESDEEDDEFGTAKYLLTFLCHRKAEVGNFGRLAGGILAAAMRETTYVDAVGMLSLSNAAKAVALANSMAENQAASKHLAFQPELLSEEENDVERRLCRLVVTARTPQKDEEPRDFSKGGIFVPQSSPGEGSATRTTPTTLARTALGQWMRYTVPDLRQAARSAARAASAGEKAVASASSTPGRQKPPFLIAMGPPAIAMGVKSLAFVCRDVRKEHLDGVPPVLVVPRLWQRKVKLESGKDRISKQLVLCLVRDLRASETSDAMR
ncbi:EHMT1 [Symbiodinium sp. CCMP2592]|nr:EHMT1 [Symbiodinium sp. CCMP2592]